MTRVATVILRDGTLLVWENADALEADGGVLVVEYTDPEGAATRMVMIPLELVKSAALDPMPA